MWNGYSASICFWPVFGQKMVSSILAGQDGGHPFSWPFCNHRGIQNRKKKTSFSSIPVQTFSWMLQNVDSHLHSSPCLFYRLLAEVPNLWLRVLLYSQRWQRYTFTQWFSQANCKGLSLFIDYRRFVRGSVRGWKVFLEHVYDFSCRRADGTSYGTQSAL